MEFKYILSRKQPFSRFMHSLCKNENIPMPFNNNYYIIHPCKCYTQDKTKALGQARQKIGELLQC